jgi:hypothetical protein
MPLNPEKLVGVGEVGIDREVDGGLLGKAVEARVSIPTRNTTIETDLHQVQAGVRSYYHY